MTLNLALYIIRKIKAVFPSVVYRIRFVITCENKC